MHRQLVEDRFPRIARAASIVVIALGTIVFLGWLLGADRANTVIPGLATMKANTAASFVLAGMSLWLQIDPGASPRRKQIARASAVVVAAIGVLTLVEYLFGINLGIDQLLIRAPLDELAGVQPGRMGPNTALALALAGGVLAGLDSSVGAIKRLLAPMTIAIFIIAFVPICGYTLNAVELYVFTGFTSMALDTALGFVALSTGILFARPRRGIVGIIAQDNPAGDSVRRFLPLILCVPLLLGWLRLKGQRAGLYDTEFGIALTVTTTTLILAALVLRNAGMEGASERVQRQASRDQSFLVDLSDLLGMSARSTDILLRVSTNLGEYLQASRCLFTAIDLVNDRSTIRADYHGVGLRSLAGSQPLSSFSPESKAAATAGHTVVNNDAITDERSAPRYQQAYLPASIRAHVAVPLLRGGHWVATLLVSTHEPRVWQDREVTLIESVAERTWLWFEHLVALEALRQSEQNLAATNSGLELRVESRTAALSAAVAEREVLLQEVHHRVKNNLQVISSLINMQTRKMTDAPCRVALDECRARVQAIALIHEKLYQAKDYTNVPFSDYARGLAANIFHATGVSRSNVVLQLDIAAMTLAVDKAIPCGLILNELITNALKHAFPNERRGTVRVELRQIGAEMLMVVGDDGIGMPANFNAAQSATLGMQLVTTLVEQLDGRLEIVRDNGTDFRIIFPVADES